MNYLKFGFTSLFLVLIALPGCRSTRRMSPEELTEKFGANTLVSDAAWTLRRSVSPDKEAPIDIPKECWVGSIKKLHPIGVYNHRFNLVAVLDSSETIETGLYIGAIQSSYSPRDGDDNFRFKQIKGGVYAFQRKK